MKRVYITTALTSLAVLAVFLFGLRLMNLSGGRDHLKIGFIYDNDESTPYTYNFSLASDALEKKYGEKVEIVSCSNVLDDEMEEPLRELAGQGCDIIFFNGYSDMVMKLAPEYPDTQFCQTSYMDTEKLKMPENYHTFKGEAYQGRYVSGIVAGMKIEQLIRDKLITEDQAIVGFVAAFPTSEVISGYTAFLLGVRSEVPTATMRVSYTHTWSSFPLEKGAAQKLIEDGCVVISQHTDTIGPAIACEEASQKSGVYFIGWGQSMAEVAPTSSLVTARIAWEPYVLSAVEAVMANKTIESAVSGRVHGNDVCAGFEEEWVEMIDLNQQVTPQGTEEAMSRAISQFKKGDGDFVFKGKYTGVNPDDLSDTIDLKNGYVENEKTSYPLFHYILSDVITIEE